MAKTKTKTIRLSDDLIEAGELRAQALGYPDLNSYYKGLARYDLLVQGEHSQSVQWAQLPLGDQDKLDAHLLRLTKKGKGERGVLLKHLLEQLAEGRTVSQVLARRE
jgi:hypothetical protein